MGARQAGWGAADDFVLSLGISVISGVHWLVTCRSGGSPLTGDFTIRIDSDAGGGCARSALAGLPWSCGASTQAFLLADDFVVPEPTSGLPALLGLCAMGIAGRLRRAQWS